MTRTTGRPSAASVETAPALPVIAALPHDVFDLRELCHELICLRWVTEHTPELEADRTARRELQPVLPSPSRICGTHLDWVFSPANPALRLVLSGQAHHPLVATGIQRPALAGLRRGVSPPRRAGGTNCSTAAPSPLPPPPRGAT